MVFDNPLVKDEAWDNTRDCDYPVVLGVGRNDSVWFFAYRCLLRIELGTLFGGRLSRMNCVYRLQKCWSERSALCEYLLEVDARLPRHISEHSLRSKAQQ